MLDEARCRCVAGSQCRRGSSAPTPRNGPTAAAWGKKEWVAPQIDNENVVSMYEGHTNCFWAERLGKEIGVSDLWVKLCGNSHTGSFKDLGMTVLISVVKQMRADGKPIRAVACASTGDTSAALAAYAGGVISCRGVAAKGQGLHGALGIQPIANNALVRSLDNRLRRLYAHCAADRHRLHALPAN